MSADFQSQVFSFRFSSRPPVKRVKAACTNCQRAHSRCSGSLPCERCLRNGKVKTCVFPFVNLFPEGSNQNEICTSLWKINENQELVLQSCDSQFEELFGIENDEKNTLTTTDNPRKQKLRDLFCLSNEYGRVEKWLKSIFHEKKDDAKEKSDKGKKIKEFEGVWRAGSQERQVKFEMTQLEEAEEKIEEGNKNIIVRLKVVSWESQKQDQRKEETQRKYKTSDSFKIRQKESKNRNQEMSCNPIHNLIHHHNQQNEPTFDFMVEGKDQMKKRIDQEDQQVMFGFKRPRLDSAPMEPQTNINRGHQRTAFLPSLREIIGQPFWNASQPFSSPGSHD